MSNLPVFDASKELAQYGNSSLKFSDLPMDAIELVVSFLDNSDQHTMALVSKQTLLAVEGLSDKKLQQIIKDHAVDRTFNARIRNQDNIETKRDKPVCLPWRYLLWAALRTYLYKINTVQNDGESNFWKMDISPSENRLSIDMEQAIAVFDLTSKERLTTVDQQSDGVFWLHDDSHLMTFAYQDDIEAEVLIWTVKNHGEEWNRTIVIWRGTLQFVSMNKEIILAGRDILNRERQMFGQLFPVFLHSIDYHNVPTVKPKAIYDGRQQGILEDLDFQCMYACGDKWLVFDIRGSSAVHERVNRRGVYVFDTSANKTVQLLDKTNGLRGGPYQQASDCSLTLFALEYKPENTAGQYTVVLFKLGDDGILSGRLSFPVSGNHISAATSSHVVVKDYEQQHEVLIYSVRTGKLETFLDVNGEAQSSVVSKKRNEPFILHDMSVSAYCLGKPRLA